MHFSYAEVSTICIKTAVVLWYKPRRAFQKVEATSPAPALCQSSQRICRWRGRFCQFGNSRESSTSQKYSERKSFLKYDYLLRLWQQASPDTSSWLLDVFSTQQSKSAATRPTLTFLSSHVFCFCDQGTKDRVTREMTSRELNRHMAIFSWYIGKLKLKPEPNKKIHGMWLSQTGWKR